MNQYFRILYYCCLSLFFVGTTSLYAQTGPTYYYVAQSGDDSNPGTELLPWKTLAKAASMATAGVTVFIRQGTYCERLLPVYSGTAEAPVTFTSYPGETATITGVGIVPPTGWWSGLIWFEGLQYIKISGLKVINSINEGIHVENGSYITIEKNYTDSTYSPGIKVGHCNNIVVEANEVAHGCLGNNEECICIGVTNLFEIKNNIVHDGFTEGIDVKVGSSNGIITRNEVYNQKAQRNPPGIYIDAWDGHEFNIDVFDNICHDNGHGFSVGSENGGLCDGIRIHHNRAYNNDRGLWVAGWGIAQEHSFNNIAIYENELYDNQVGIEIGGYTGTNIDSIEVSNNLIYRNKNVGIRITRYDGPSGDYILRNIAIINNTIYGNGSVGNGWYADNGGVNLFNIIPGNFLIRNNILSNNASCTIFVAPEVPADSVTIDYNFFNGFRNVSYETAGTNAIYGNPLFVDSLNNDYHLQDTSPGVDKGDPNQQYNDPADTDNPGFALYPARGTLRNDMGAYGGPFASFWDLATLIIPPSVPTLISPFNGATGVPTRLLLSWNGPWGATSYQLQVSTSSDFLSMVIDTSIIGQSCGIMDLANNAIYYWRVKATNAGGTSTWSEKWSFTTAYPTGIKEHISSEIFRIYPVPVDGIFKIEGIDIEYTIISIFSQEGKLLRQTEGTGIQEIDVSEFQKGVYLVKISNSQTVITKKIVKL